MAVLTSGPAVRSRFRAARAFTLVEVMCVIVIMAIAAAIVFAGLSNTNDIQAESGASSVLTDLMYAQTAPSPRNNMSTSPSMPQPVRTASAVH